MVKGNKAFLALVALAGMLLALPPAAAQRLKTYRHRPEAPGIAYLVRVEKGVIKLTNEVRRKNGLPVLTREPRLCRLARQYCDDMLLRRFFSHVNPEGQTPQERLRQGYPYSLEAVGENIYGADGSEPLETELLARIMVDSWMSSPGHRRNILNPEFTDIGVGVAALGKQLRATQIFAKLKN
jgi:uncharacterized protein YkwD|uniref:CAP domain-containing protein n=1 Tax=Desulfobacca acetoxidans TaxID=60893 RepID=A0A7C3SM36_9BACT